MAMLGVEIDFKALLCNYCDILCGFRMLVCSFLSFLDGFEHVATAGSCMGVLKSFSVSLCSFYSVFLVRVALADCKLEMTAIQFVCNQPFTKMSDKPCHSHATHHVLTQ